MKKIMFLASGNGGLLKFIFLCINKKILPHYEISSVITDRTCGAYVFAQKEGIACQVIKYNVNHRQNLLVAMKQYGFDIAITNIHKILDPEIVNHFNGKLVNVHPSLLPAFGGGLYAIDDALAYGVKFIGTTVHYVIEAVDAGEIIAQSIMPVIAKESREAITDQQFRAWCLNLLNVLFHLSGEGFIDETEVYQRSTFNPPLCFRTEHFDETFWNEVRGEVR